MTLPICQSAFVSPVAGKHLADKRLERLRKEAEAANAMTQAAALKKASHGREGAKDQETRSA
jgi:hypothetical protein